MLNFQHNQTYRAAVRVFSCQLGIGKGDGKQIIWLQVTREIKSSGLAGNGGADFIAVELDVGASSALIDHEPNARRRGEARWLVEPPREAVC